MGLERILHDTAHLAMIPLGLLVFLGFFNESIEGWVHRADLLVHGAFLAVMSHDFLVWYKHKRGTAHAD